MRWLTLAGVLLYLTRCSDAGVVKCSPESRDPLCASEKRDISPPPSPDAECLAGSEWESNCHFCRCSDSGVAECLKQDSCELQVFEEPVKCKPSTKFLKDCNTCTCLENGLGLCTLKGCATTDRRKRQIPAQDSQKSCEPGSRWKESCNSCWCTDARVTVCTKIGCLGTISKREAPAQREQKECEPGTSWKNSCNTCRCTDNGVAICTRKQCFDPVTEPTIQKRDTAKSNATLTRKTRGAQEAAKTCQPGTEFRMDCNKCLCNDEGQDFSCTRIDCAAQNGNGGADSFTSTRSKRELSETVSMQCVAGSVFDRECNVCRCTTDGLHAVCTLKRCKKETTEAVTESTPSFRCTPGDQFKRDCNDCTCSADGKTEFCTIRLCDQILADIDGGQ